MLPWALPSAQLWQTSTWKNLKPEPYSHHQTPLYCGRRFVDDTFVIMKKCHREEFLQHLNSVDKNIQFTAEEPGPEGALPFLDILIKPDQEGRLHTTVYRKPTHTDQYLHWDSLHPVSSKYSVVGTLHHRANTICSDQQLLLSILGLLLRLEDRKTVKAITRAILQNYLYIGIHNILSIQLNYRPMNEGTQLQIKTHFTKYKYLIKHIQIINYFNRNSIL